jgi:hypothetical protein
MYLQAISPCLSVSQPSWMPPGIGSFWWSSPLPAEHTCILYAVNEIQRYTNLTPQQQGATIRKASAGGMLAATVASSGTV